MFPRRIAWIGLALWAFQAVAAAQGTSNAFVAKIPAGSIPSSVVLAASTVAGLPGSSVTVPIVLTNAGSMAPVGFQFDLTFDPTIIGFVSASGEAGLSASAVAGGAVHFSTGAGQGVILNSQVANVVLTVAPQFSGNTPLTLVRCLSTGSGGVALSTGCGAGAVTTFTCDTNGDGKVTVADVQSAINQALGLAPYGNDLDHDGEATVGDIQKLILGTLYSGCGY